MSVSNSKGYLTSLTQTGTGSQLSSGVSGSVLPLKTLVAGNSMTITSSSTELKLDASQPLGPGDNPTFNTLSLKGTSIITSSTSSHPTTMSVPAMGQTTTISVPDPAKTTASVTLTEGDTAVNGAWTFNSTIFAPFGPIGSASAINSPVFNAQGTSNQLVLSSPNSFTTTFNNDNSGQNSTINIVSIPTATTYLPLSWTSGPCNPTFSSITFYPGFTGSTQSDLNNYEVFSHSTNWSGPIGATAGNIQVVVMGNQVFLNVPNVTTTGASSATAITQATALPARIRPAATVTTNIAKITNNGTVSGPGIASLSTAGVITVTPSATVNTFTSSTNQTGFFDFRVTYYVAFSLQEEKKDERKITSKFTPPKIKIQDDSKRSSKSKPLKIVKSKDSSPPDDWEKIDD